MKKTIILLALVFTIISCKKDIITEQKDVKNILTFVIDSIFPGKQTYCNNFLDLPFSDNFRQIIPQYCDTLFKYQIDYITLQYNNKNIKKIIDFIDTSKIKMNLPIDTINYFSLKHRILSKPLFSKDHKTCVLIVFSSIPKYGHIEDFLVFKLKDSKNRLWHYSKLYTNNNLMLDFTHTCKSFFILKSREK